MNSKIKKRWLTALRSGDYKQSKNSLKSSDGYCCLGVLCDVVKGDLNIDWEDNSCDKDSPFRFRIDEETHYLPLSVSVYADLVDNDKSSAKTKKLYNMTIFEFTRNSQVALSHLNDCNNDFEAIANIIEDLL